MAASLKKSVKDAFIFHVHSLVPESVKKREIFHKERFKSQGLPDNIIQSKYLLKNLKKLRKEKKCYVVSLIRDPIAATVSEIWENYPKSGRNNIVEKVTSKFFEVFGSETKYRLNWFEDELKKSMGIDIFKEKLQKNNGWNVIKKKDMSLLIVKLEKMNNVIRAAMEYFLGIKNFKTVIARSADQKVDYQIYEKIKKNIAIDRNMIDAVYSSKYIRYFYNHNEIRAFTLRWSK
jgi:hypothetical protein